MNSAVALKPFIYVPKKKKGKFIDDIAEYSATSFKNTGIICGCSGKTYRNKYTFQYQHLNTARHKEWLNSYKENKNNEVCKICPKRDNEIKQLKVMVGSIDQENFVLKQSLLTLNKKVEELEKIISELNENKLQYDEHIVDLMNEINNEKQKNKVIENAALIFMNTLGYDCSD